MRNREWALIGLSGGIAGCGLAVLAAFLVAGALVAAVVRSWDTDTSIGPGKGTASVRLDVDVAPASDLDDRTVVTVTSDAFDPHRVVGVAVCLSEADTGDEGVDACDTTSGARYATDADGRLHATFAVPRVITVGGTAHDCAATEARCILVAADASDFDRSGGRPIRFRPHLPDVDLRPSGPRPRTDLLPVTATDAPVPPGSAVEVHVSGFQPGEPLLVARCAGFPDEAVEAACDPLDLDDALTAIMGRSVFGIDVRARPDGTFTTTVTADATVERPLRTDPVDCASAPGRCAIVVAAAADTRRSAVAPYTLTAG